MRVGDLVRIVDNVSFDNRNDAEWIHRRMGLHGVVLVDHSPMRPPEVGRVFDVMWNNGTIEDMYAHELEAIDEGR